MLRVERDGPVEILTLDRPDAMNALSKALRGELCAAIRRSAADPDIHVLILTGAGRAFCAGLDLKELAADGRELLLGGEAADPVAAITECPKPIIAALNGVAITGGFELALACDVLIASTNARFADTHARIGVMPGWGLSQKLSRLIGPYRAKELSLSGNFLDAETACAWGLVNRVVAPDQLLATARALAADIASVPPERVANYKRLIDEGYALSFGEALRRESEVFQSLNVDVSKDALEADRRQTIYRGRAQREIGKG